MTGTNQILKAIHDVRGALTEIGRITVAATRKDHTVPASLLENVLNTRLIDPPADCRVWEALPPALVARCGKALTRSGRRPRGRK